MSPPSPTSGQAYRRHLARTSRGRNFTQPRTLVPGATTTPAPQAAAATPLRTPPTLHQHTLDQGDVDVDGDEEEMDDTRDSDEEDEEDEEEEGAEGEDVTEEIDGADGDGEGAIEEALVSRRQFWDVPPSTVGLEIEVTTMAYVQSLETPRSPSPSLASSDSLDPGYFRIYSSGSSAASLPSRTPTPEVNSVDQGAPREVQLSRQDSGVQPRYVRRGRNRPVPAFGWENLQAARRMLTPSTVTVPMEIDPPFDTTGLKEIGNLASWTVSTCKPGCGVEALRDEDTTLFWQSDGPQPHHLNIHFSRLVSILSIRIFLDFEADESYTPTRITLLAGTGYHDLIPFSSLEFTQPKGWIDVPLEGVGGGVDGNTLRAFLVQVKVVENHQNGKDTHVRGLKIYARDERAIGGLGGLEELVDEKTGGWRERVRVPVERTGMLTEPDWMGEPELR